MVESMEVSPAYGRSYKSAGEVQAGWDEGHDFYSHTHGAYTSSRDMEALGYPTVTVRYGHKNPAHATQFYNIQHPENATPEEEPVVNSGPSPSAQYGKAMRAQISAQNIENVLRTAAIVPEPPTEEQLKARVNAIQHVKAAGPYKKKK